MLSFLSSAVVLSSVCLVLVALLLRLEANRVAREHERQQPEHTENIADEQPERRSA